MSSIITHLFPCLSCLTKPKPQYRFVSREKHNAALDSKEVHLQVPNDKNAEANTEIPVNGHIPGEIVEETMEKADESKVSAAAPVRSDASKTSESRSHATGLDADWTKDIFEENFLKPNNTTPKKQKQEKIERTKLTLVDDIAAPPAAPTSPHSRHVSESDETHQHPKDMDAYQLQRILNKHFEDLKHFKGFSIDVCRSMVAMYDEDLSGRLTFEEFKSLWKDLRLCKDAFTIFDKDGKGYFDRSEFASILEEVGLTVDERILKVLTVRYSDDEGHIHFNDFIGCTTKLRNMTDSYIQKLDPAMNGHAKFTVDEFIQLGLYS